MSALDVVVLVGYFVGVTLFGYLSGRGTKTTHEFFFAGQRYGWFVIAMSCVATVVGSYSFVKYSGRAFRFGVAATQNYLNDWMWVPLFIGGWLPILWKSGVCSVPEYFQRRFDGRVRAAVTLLLTLYMVGYIGINFRTLGVVLDTLQPIGSDPFWSQMFWSTVVAVLCAVYVTSGGQVSVIATDLFQGALLLIAGFVLLGLGMAALSDVGGLWANLPRGHMAAFTPLTKPPDFAAVGLFWQDGIANSAAFYFINQGLVMRFLSARDQAEGRKAISVVVLILMPIAAVAVCGGGWVARALEGAGLLSLSGGGDKIFVEVTRYLTAPGFFGLLMAALTAALMSTADTLINATAAVFVNDVWRPYVAKERDDTHYLAVARWASIVTAAVGIALVPIFMGFKSIFDAHGAFTAAITPPLVVALLMGVLWRRYSSSGALATLLAGTLAVVLSMQWPALIEPFSHGVAAAGEGAKAFKYIRAFYGIVVCFGLGLLFTLMRPNRRAAKNLVVSEME